MIWFSETMSVPVVQLVLEGGPRTLETVKETLSNGIPVVVVKVSCYCHGQRPENYWSQRNNDLLLSPRLRLCLW